MRPHQAVTDLLKPLQTRIRLRRFETYPDFIGTVEEQNLEKHYLRVILALSETVDALDSTCISHAPVTATVATTLANRLGLAADLVEDIRWASLLHDVGKIEVPGKILRKPAPLSAEEWKFMRQHPAIGARLLAPVEGMSRVADFVLQHHERWDGLGYPQGLRGSQIELGARIISLADAYSVMVTGRVYCAARSFDDSAVELKRCAGTQFDPALVQVFIELLEGGSFYSSQS